jgi:signal transduction histidine kinase
MSGPQKSDKKALTDIKVSVENAILEALWTQSKRAPLPVIMMAIILTALAWGKISHSALLFWFLLVLVVLLIRFNVIRLVMKDVQSEPVERLRRVARLSILSGIVHGGSLFMFPFFSESERALQTVLLIGLATGTVATSLGQRRIFLSYSIPTVGGVALSWALFPANEVPLWTSYSLAILVVYLGVTLYLLAEENFAKFAEQIMQKEKLSIALDREEAANRAKTRFLAAASHDLRQPLHTLSLFGAALRMRNLDAKSQEIAEQINIATRDLTFELDALLDISKLDARVVTVERNRFSLNQTIRQLVDAYRPIAAEKDLTITFSEQDSIDVVTDRILLERIVRNIIDNAVKYTQKGVVRVTVQRRIDTSTSQSLAEVSVQDSGPGIANDQMELIFEEFYQISNQERDRSKGLGLGLSIVKRMAELMGGRIDVQSVIGHGSTFNFTLPAESEVNLTIPVSTKATVPTGALEGLRVIVIDDEAQVRNGMRTLLEAYGVKTYLAADVNEAVAHLFQDEKVDVLCVDYRLGKSKSGLQAIETLRQMRPLIPAVLISGDTAPAKLREASDAGITLLHKPLRIDDLATELLRLSGRT